MNAGEIARRGKLAGGAFVFAAAAATLAAELGAPTWVPPGVVLLGVIVGLGLLLHEGRAEGQHREDPAGATNLGVMLHKSGDLKGAEAAYRRADQRGDPDAASNLAFLLEERGDLKGAEEAFRRADEAGDADGAYNLGFLLQERGDLKGAEAAYRRADERGDPDAAYNLGFLLQERGDLKGAEAAYRRADERGAQATPPSPGPRFKSGAISGVDEPGQPSPAYDRTA